MKILASVFFFAYLLQIHVSLFSQNNELIIGANSESVFIHDFDDIELSPGYCLDIDYNNTWDLKFYIVFNSGWWGGVGGIIIYANDSTYFSVDTTATQLIGEGDHLYIDTTSMVKKYSLGDTMTNNDYFLDTMKMTWIDVWTDPYYRSWWLDDWVGGEHYIGFKKYINRKHYLGWIKVEVPEVYQIIIKEIAIKGYEIQLPKIKINEFMLGPQTTFKDEFGEYDPWIEIYNAGNDSVWLGNKYLNRDIVNSEKWQMPDVFIQPNEVLLFWADNDPEQGPFHTDFTFYYANRVMATIDQNTFIINKHYYVDYTKNISEGRFPDGGPGDWVFFNYPTPGENNGKITDLKINEFMASNLNTVSDEYGEFDDWFELYNPGEDSIFLGDHYITDNLYSPKKWKMPDINIKPGEFLLFWADDQTDQGPFHTNFKLDDDGEAIGIFPNSAYKATDTYTFTDQSAGISEGRLPNGSDNWAFFNSPTPGASNNYTYTQENKDTLDLKIYPNPISNGIVLLNKAASFKVYDVNGQVIINKNTGNSIDISMYPDGLYFIITEKGNKLKLIKRTTY